MENHEKDINFYLNLPYTFEVVQEDETTWFARVRELPGCITEGDSPSDALTMLQDALAGWLEAALNSGYPIPEPKPSDEYSGKFNLRVSRSLHRSLVEAAERDNVSLNQYIATELARAVGSGYQASGTRDLPKTESIPPEVERDWPGIGDAAYELLRANGLVGQAAAADQLMFSSWFQDQVRHVEELVRLNHFSEATSRLNGLSTQLHRVRERSPIIHALELLVRTFQNAIDPANLMPQVRLERHRMSYVSQQASSDAPPERSIVSRLQELQWIEMPDGARWD